MSPDEDAHLQESLNQLHRQWRAQAPPFEGMRERAERECEIASRPRRGWAGVTPRLTLAAALIVILALGVAWFRLLPEPSSQTIAVASASPQQVQQILDRIETRLQLDEFLLAPSYPTDVLLTQNSAEPNP